MGCQLDAKNPSRTKSPFFEFLREAKGEPAASSYAYCSGVFSSRRIAKRIHEDIAFRVLAAGHQIASWPARSNQNQGVPNLTLMSRCRVET